MDELTDHQPVDRPETPGVDDSDGETGFLPRSMHWPLWAGAVLLALATLGGITIMPRLLPA